jgi:hypothetical protein
MDVSWRVSDDGTMRLEVVAPAGVEVAASLPHGMTGTVLVNGSRVN